MNSYARELRNNATDAEKLLWRHLRGRQVNGFKFRRQHPMGKYVCDFVCLEAGVIVELDAASMGRMRHTTSTAMPT
jgi:very-short-patch-repair endonuclease